ncbi:MAG: RidA family protein [Chloroflexota bacterium]
MPKQVFNLTGAVPGVPYSSAAKAGPLVFVSGQIGALDDAGKPISTVEGQTRQLLRKMKIALDAAGASLSDVTKTTVFLVNVNDFAVMNQVYKEFFPREPPARSTVIVDGLAKPEWLVEIEAIAYKP